MARLENASRMVFLHHSTGGCVWEGGVAEWFARFNAANKANHQIREVAFPKSKPYGWANYPYDYWNIWVSHAGAQPFKEEPTLEMLTKDNDVIIFKHCFPVANVQADAGAPDVASDAKTLGNYKLQYEALKEKLHQFPQTRFIVWTGAALVKRAVSEENALRAREFCQWVKGDWDEKGDNIFVWDFDELETGGGLYLKPENAASEEDSHPNKEFCKSVAPLFCQRIVNVIQGRGDTTSLTGRQPGRGEAVL